MPTTINTPNQTEDAAAAAAAVTEAKSWQINKSLIEPEHEMHLSASKLT